LLRTRARLKGVHWKLDSMIYVGQSNVLIVHLEKLEKASQPQ